MAINTRIASTIAARYVPTKGAVDAFYLDGRITSKRESQFAELTVDRTDRGFFYAVYASSHGDQDPSEGNDGNRIILDKISKDIKKGTNHHKIDFEINELADAAVNVAGRLMLSDEGVAQPYFAGLIVKDGEMAAVTLGRGCAYLYRDDALFPLTKDDFLMEPIDHYGRHLNNINDFYAGVAGSIRYSNIAQLKQDDCIIVCNCDLMETVGQKTMLRLLDEAEDQADAVGLIMNEAVHRNSHISMQIMIGFVEDLLPIDRQGRNTLTKGLNIRDTLTGGIQEGKGPINIPKAPRTTGVLSAEDSAKIKAYAERMDREAAALANGLPRYQKDEWKYIGQTNRPDPIEHEADPTVPMVEKADEPNAQADEAPMAESVEAAPVSPETDSTEHPETIPVVETEAVMADHDAQEPMDQPEAEDGSHDEFDEYVVPQDSGASVEEIYDVHQQDVAPEVEQDAWSFGDDREPTEDELKQAVANALVESDGEWFEGDTGVDYVDFEEDEVKPRKRYRETGYSTASRRSNGSPIILVVLVLIALVLIGFIIRTLTKGFSGGQRTTTAPTPAVTASASVSQTASLRQSSQSSSTVPSTFASSPPSTTLPPSTTTTTTTTAPPTTSTAAPTKAPSGTYVVKQGDSLWKIVKALYPNDEPIAKMNEIAKANGKSTYQEVELFPGNELKLP